MTIVLACLFALVAWWGSTAAIIFLDALPRRTFKYSLAGLTALALVCLWGLHATAGDPSVAGAYCAFSCGLVAWGWQEMSFYTGLVTGPRKAPCDAGAGGWARFGQALAVLLWHELAIVAMAAAVLALTWGGGNLVGWWTVLALWLMRSSAKLNVFLGVRNLHEGLLPAHLTYLQSYFSRRPMNPLLPISVAVTGAATAAVAAAALAAATPGAQAGLAMLATLLALGVLEHAMLVVPVPAAVLRLLGSLPRGQTEGPAAAVIARRSGSTGHRHAPIVASA